MNKPLKYLTLLAAIPLFLCGCKGYRETDSEYFITAVCFEKAGEGFRVYIEVPDIENDEEGVKSKVFISTGKTPYEAVNGTLSLMPKNAVFDHCGTAVVASDIKGEELKSVVKYLYDTKNLNLGIYMFVCDDIEKLLSCESQSAGVGYDIMAIEKSTQKSSGVDFKNKYYEIVSRQISCGAFCLPEVTGKDGRPAIDGEYVYSGFDPVAVLDNDEAMLYNLIYSGSKGGEICVFGKRSRVDSVKPDTKVSGDTLKISLNCRYRHKSDELSNEIKQAVLDLFLGDTGDKLIKPLDIGKVRRVKRVEVEVNGE